MPAEHLPSRVDSVKERWAVSARRCRVWATTVDGSRVTAYSDVRRPLVITKTYRPRVEEYRYAITHRKTGLVVCQEAVFPSLTSARAALRALLRLERWEYYGQQYFAEDTKASILTAMAVVKRAP